MVKAKFEYKGEENEIDVDGIFSAAVIDNEFYTVVIADGSFSELVVMEALVELVMDTIGNLHEANPNGVDKFGLLKTFLRLLGEKGE